MTALLSSPPSPLVVRSGIVKQACFAFDFASPLCIKIIYLQNPPQLSPKKILQRNKSPVRVLALVNFFFAASSQKSIFKSLLRYLLFRLQLNFCLFIQRLRTRAPQGLVAGRKCGQIENGSGPPHSGGTFGGHNRGDNRGDDRGGGDREGGISWKIGTLAIIFLNRGCVLAYSLEK